MHAAQLRHSFGALTLAALCLVGVTPALAQDGPQAPEVQEGPVSARDAEALMRASGLWDQLGRLQAQAEGGFRLSIAQAGTQEAEQVERLARSLAEGFAPQALRLRARSELSRLLVPEHLRALRSWFGSDLGQRIAKLEAAEPAGDQQERARAGEALLEQASDERRTALEELVQATRAADSLTHVTLNFIIAMQRAAGLARGAQNLPSEDEVREGMRAQLAQIKETYAVLVLSLFAQAYQSLDDAALRGYVNFLRTAPGAHFNDATVRALDRALVAAAGTVGAAATLPPR